jgi:4-hydroxybenzoyl-CoA thioesterase
MTFTTTQQVRFAHIDAAGIVFYPRYFEMLNAALEDYFAQEVGCSFAVMHLQRRIGVPTVKLEIDFSAVSRLGDILDFTLEPVRVGTSSAEFIVSARHAGEQRFGGRIVLVCMDLDAARAMPWPDDVRPKLGAKEL